ncbi:MAG TPA: NTP transferase domain-containing protein [Firmicutes bacterium]|nr:NTP transferase domain-containing protein [Bacillota bacterium]
MKALILAAGMGTRLRPITETLPKTMVPVLGEPMVQRQIRFLREIGIDEITVVTGYLAEKLAPLKRQYGVRLVHNPRFNVWQNLYSLYVAREYLEDTYILEGDVYLVRNFLDGEIRESAYFSGIKTDFQHEWVLEYDDQDRVTHISVHGGSGYIMSGVSYWTAADGQTIRELLEEAVAKPGFETMFWDDLIKDNLSRFRVAIRRIASDDWFEIDTVAELEALERRLANVAVG